MDLRKGQIIDLAIERLAYGGEGIGKYEGKVTFVPNVLPGDRVRAALTKIKSNRMEADLSELVEPSSLRVTPRCRHFNECGGCTWQNLSYENQLRFKEEQVREALEHVGHFSAETCDRVMKPILGCTEPWMYRNKMEFSFGTASLENQTPQLGLHVPGRRYDIFNLTECFLTSPLVADLVTRVRDFVIEAGLTVYHEGRNEGLLRNVLIREGKHTGEIMLALITSDEPFDGADRFRDLFKNEPRVTSLLHTIKIQKRGVRTSFQSMVLAGAPVIHEELHLENGQVLRFEIGPEAFFQPNTLQAEKLYAKAIELAALTGEDVVYDLYCGTGTIGLFCAHAARAVYGIELNEEAVRNARQNATSNAIQNVHFLSGDVGKVLGQSFESIGGPPPPPDVVIVDPPRAGLTGDAPRKVAGLGAKKIIYVSCNPATLARDLETLTQQGYRLEAVQPVDMFPHTYHIENVALLISDF